MNRHELQGVLLVVGAVAFDGSSGVHADTRRCPHSRAPETYR